MTSGSAAAGTGPGGARWGSPPARRAVATTALGSGVVFLDGTIVNVALPSIGADLDAGLSGLQWVLDGYLVTLTALLLLGGSLGDRFGRRRVFRIGVAVFTASSVLCALAPTTAALVAARALQGAGGALLVPGSLALLSASLHPDDRGRAVGAWSGLTGVASALGPLLGGWLVDAASWRWAFLINVPLAVVVVVLSRGVVEAEEVAPPGHLDLAGALSAAAALGLLTAGLIAGGEGWTGRPVGLVAAGVVAGAAFVVVERRSPAPMLPPALFRSRPFVGVNLVTLAVYAGLGVAFFLTVLNLQLALGYSALEAGGAMLPVTAAMLVLSPRSGALAQRIGTRVPLTVGPLVAAAGLAGLARVVPGDAYASGVLPAVALLGLGLGITVAPLTAAVLAAVADRHLGVASAANSAVARLGGLLAVAVLPAVAGVELAARPGRALAGYAPAMLVAAGLCAVGAAVGWASGSGRRPGPPQPAAPPAPSAGPPPPAAG